VAEAYPAVFGYVHLAVVLVAEQGSKCSNFHCFKAKAKLDPALSQALRQVVCVDWNRGGTGFGWVQSKAKNRFWFWRGKLGRVVWFETGSVRLHVRRPGNLGRAKQLFCDAFVNTGLLTDFEVLNPILERIRPKSGHFPYSAGERLPYMVIRDFELSHGVVIKVGDRSHPDAVEVIASFSDVVDDALDRLEKIEKSSLKNCEAPQKMAVLFSKVFCLDSGGQSGVKGSGGLSMFFSFYRSLMAVFLVFLGVFACSNAYLRAIWGMVKVHGFRLCNFFSYSIKIG